MSQPIFAGRTAYFQARNGVWQREGNRNADQHSYVDAKEYRLLESVRSCKDVSLYSDELRALQVDWPAPEYLSPLRANLLRPFLAKIRSGTVLELGGGCGVLTRFLGETGAEVLAVESSARRSSIIAERCRDLPNVTVLTETIAALELEQKFDIVTLIDFLELAQGDENSKDAMQGLLELATSLLTDDGVLILSVSNQLGLKYLCRPEDKHLERPMFGVNDAGLMNAALDCSRAALEEKFKRAGLLSVELFVPCPDDKSPVSIVYPGGFGAAAHEAGWDAAPLLANASVHARQQSELPAYSVEMTLQTLARNGLAQSLANTFLFALGRQPSQSDQAVLAAHYGFQRPARFAKEKQFILNAGAVWSRKRSTADTASISCDEWIVEPYQAGQRWSELLLEIVNRPGWSVAQISDWADFWIQSLRAQSPVTTDHAIAELHGFTHLLPARYFDATPFNLVKLADGTGKFFNLEWSFTTAVPVEFVVLRGLFLSLERLTCCESPALQTSDKLFELALEVMEMSGLSIDIDGGDLEVFVELFNAFQNQMQGQPKSSVNHSVKNLSVAVLPVRIEA
jgi:2-polyprenyl-3-methyl-5-hydroxy-6-metoxy-1,4-benzoquinol methylase